MAILSEQEVRDLWVTEFDPPQSETEGLVHPPSSESPLPQCGNGEQEGSSLQRDGFHSGQMDPQGSSLRASYRYYRPLSDAADDLIEAARTLRTGERIYTGIDVFDAAMRGLAPKELMVVNGFAHEGKTLFVTEMLRYNTDRCIIMFSADENCQLILAKLCSLVSGISAERLEERLSDPNDVDALELLHSTSDYFQNLVVYDEISDLRTMTDALAETEEMWGRKCELVVFDYLDLLSGLGDGDTHSKFNAIKSWGKRHNVPLVLMHQSSRSKGADGAEVTLTSGAYGGEQQATFVVGVRRKRTQYASRIRELRTKLATQQSPSQRVSDQLAEAEYDCAKHQDTVTFSLLKNKRPPSILVGDTDFALEAATGRVSPLVQAFAKTSGIHGRRPVSAAELVQWSSDDGELPF